MFEEMLTEETQSCERRGEERSEEKRREEKRREEKRREEKRREEKRREEKRREEKRREEKRENFLTPPKNMLDCFECTDWHMFMEAAINGDSINLEQYTASVHSYIGKCIDDVTISKTITIRSNQKLWMTAKDCFECTDWHMFMEAAINGDSINLEQYTASVHSYIGKCIDDVTISKTITIRSNQKLWMTAKDCFECTDWHMFMEAAINGDSINLEQYTASVHSYIGKCIDDVTISKTITIRSNQKLWMTAKDCFECTDWHMFMEAAINGDSINLEQYTASVHSYIGKCIDDVTISKTITIRSNQKLWMTAKQDNVPCHKAEMVQEWFDEHNNSTTAFYNRTPGRTVGDGHVVCVRAVSDSAVFGQAPLPRMETSHVECGKQFKYFAIKLPQTFSGWH
ncbi:hypothetical protein QTP86_007340 [Hemibagrus guttatus]|nr:hypothetical protein QTP86_007340 [Hemibagrus guttatus]